MPIWYSPPLYILGLAAWLAAMALGGRYLLARRQARRLAKRSSRGVDAALCVWVLAAFLTAGEVVFALFVDHSDAFNLTNVSKRWMDRHIEAQRNAFGARDFAEFDEKPPAGTKRIAFVGDSFTIGHGVRNRADRFTDRVAATLEAKHPGRYVVSNLADPGLEIAQVAARVQGVLEAGYRLDVVVYVICLNDIEGYDPKTDAAIKSLQTMQSGNPLVAHTYFPNWVYYRGVQVTNRGARDYFPHLVESYDGAPWDGFSAKLKRLHEVCRRHKAELRVAIFPFLTELGPSYPFQRAHRKIAAYCGKLDVRCVDLEPALARYAADNPRMRLTVNRFDAHPNETAHAVAAKAMIDAGLFQPELQPDSEL